MSARTAFLGIDVGTGSARAGLFSPEGVMLGTASEPIRMWRPRPDHVQQSSDDIWRAVCSSVRRALAAAGAPVVTGIGLDATCSLVVLDDAGQPVSVDVDGAPEQNVMVWMDHRAADQAARINAGEHEVLRYVGGRISLEMEVPKLLWLRESLPEAWGRAAHFFDLPDYLTFRATGALSRSLCSAVCKWTYLGHEVRWDAAFFRAVGLGDLVDESFRRIGQVVLPMGTPVGSGLSSDAAAAFGLPAGIPVGASAIDAHAGGLGVIGAALDGDPALDRRLALVGGTSSCHMVVSAQPRFVPGVWGPYFSAMVPGLWLNEGGQSATGALIDHLVRTHAAYPEVAGLAEQAGQHPFAWLAGRLRDLAGEGDPDLSTGALHVDPDFHGNRSPHADPSLRGTVSGLTLSAGADDLARLYLAGVQAVAYGTRSIIAALNAKGYAIDTIMACGGGTKDAVFLRAHADATGCRVVLPAEPDAVLLGAAMLGAVAAGHHASLEAAMGAMSRAGTVIAPRSGAPRRFHDAKYAVFQRLHDDSLAYRRLMDEASAA